MFIEQYECLLQYCKFSNGQQLETIKMSCSNNEYRSTKINKLELRVTTCMKLTKTMLSERIQPQKEDIVYNSIYIKLKK